MTLVAPEPESEPGRARWERREREKPRLHEARHPLVTRLSAGTRIPPPRLPPGSRGIRRLPRLCSLRSSGHRIPSRRELGSRRAPVPSASLNEFPRERRRLNPAFRQQRPGRFQLLLSAPDQLCGPAEGSRAPAAAPCRRLRRRHTGRPALSSPRDEEAWPRPRGGGGGAGPTDFVGYGTENFDVGTAHAGLRGNQNKLQVPGGEDVFSSSEKTPPPSPKSGRGRSRLPERSPRAPSERRSRSPPEKLRAGGAPPLPSPSANPKGASRWRGCRAPGAKSTESSADPGGVRGAGPPTRLPPGKVTATKCVPSGARTDTRKGRGGRQHPASSGESGAARGGRPSPGRGARRRRCGASGPRAPRQSPRSAGPIEPSRGCAGSSWPLCARAPSAGSPRRSEPGLQRNHSPLAPV